MTTATLRKPCPDCGGKGIVARSRPWIDGKLDPFDTRTEEACWGCTGTGRVADAGPASETAKPAAAIDPGDCCQ